MRGCKFESYKFQNIYIITTYRCNWDCEFCLFKYNNEKETSVDEIIDKLEYSIKDSQKKVYIKITGGEPFLRLDLLEAIFKLSEKYQDKVYKIGIGTNGSIYLPEFFNRVKIKTHIFLSRHSIESNMVYEPNPSDLVYKISNLLIDFRVNCNLIKGKVDNIETIKQYIESKKNISNHFCFRGLTKVNVDKNLMYPKQIYDYMEYYNKHHVCLSDIEKELQKDSDFKPSRIVGNYYDINKWYWYKNISIKFRSIDEEKLIDFNVKIEPNDIDEYVIHPDGTLTGCWDKDLKLIMKGGEYNAK